MLAKSKRVRKSNRALPFHTTYDGDGKLVKLSENGAVKNYYIVSSVLDTTIADLTNTGAMETGYMLAPEGGRIASRKDNEVKFLNYDLSGIGQSSFKMDKTGGGGETYDGWGQKVTYYGYTSGGPCGNNCPGGYTPPSNMGALQEFENMRLTQRWQDTVFWNLFGYITAGIVVGNTPPAGWDPYKANLNKIRSDQAFAGYGLFGEGSLLTSGFQNWSSQTRDVRVPTNEQLVKGLADLRDRKDGKCGEFLDKLRSNLGIEKTFEDLFADVLKKYDSSKGKKGGIAYVDTLMSTKVSIGDKSLPADGAYPYNGKDIYGAKRKGAVVLKTKPLFNDSVQVNGYVNDLIHELVHYAGIEGHKAFADAAFGASDGKDAVPNKPAIEGYGMSETYSKYFDKLFAKYCK